MDATIGLTPTASRAKWLALAASCMGTFTTTLDGNIVQIALPTFTKVFSASPTAVVWVSLVNYLILAGLQMTFAMVADIIGRRKVFILGFAFFTIGLALGAVAQGIGQLVFYRALQGVGMAMISAVGVAILIAAFPPSERGKALGIMSIVTGAGITIGPVLGGFLIDHLGWPSIFYIRVPLALAGLVLSWVAISKSTEKSRRAFDIRGALLLLGFMSFLVIGINQGPRLGWSSPLLLSLFAASAMLLLFLIVVEARSAHAAVDLRLFGNRRFSSALITLFFRNMSQMVVFIVMPFYLIQARGFSPSVSGVYVMLIPLGLLALGPVFGSLSDRVSRPALSTAGVAVMTSGFALLTLLDMNSSSVQIAAGPILVGAGLGIFEAPNIGLMMDTAPKDKMNAASALISTVRQLSHATGVAVAGTIFVARQLLHQSVLAGQGLEPGMLQRLSISSAFRDAMVVTAFIGVLAVVSSLVHGKR